MIQMLFALFLFAFLGIAALVVDVGVARVTHLQMRNAAEGAAMEGLRQRDWTPSKSARRTAAADVVRWTFDDDLDPATPDPYNHGAGPLYDLSGGAPGTHALQKISIPTPAVYLPDLELNLGDEIYGDMVAGEYFIDDLAHHEAADYTRTDFSPGFILASLVRGMIQDLINLGLSPPGIANSLLVKLQHAADALDDLGQPGALQAARAGLQSFIAQIEAQSGHSVPPAAADDLATRAQQVLDLLDQPQPPGLRAFLVRLRRTADPTDPTIVPPLDDVAGVSTTGPALSYLLGRGALIDNAMRRDGITVRATSIAAARPATSVGPSTVVRGAARLVLEYDFWNSLGGGSVLLRRANPSSGDDTALISGGVVVGHFVDEGGWSIGDSILPRLDNPSGDSVDERYIPIYDEIDQNLVVVGFGDVQIRALPSGMQLTRRPSTIALRNVSAVMAPGLSGYSNQVLRAILNRYHGLSEPLHAAVLVR